VWNSHDRQNGIPPLLAHSAKAKMGIKIINFNFIRRTGQMWKIYIDSILTVCGVFLFILQMQAIQAHDCGIKSFLFVMFGVGIYIPWTFMSVKCPKCRCFIVYQVLKTSEHNKWLNKLLELEKCPKCGYDPAQTESSISEAPAERQRDQTK
jgi:hypothetical protein